MFTIPEVTLKILQDSDCYLPLFTKLAGSAWVNIPSGTLLRCHPDANVRSSTGGHKPAIFHVGSPQGTPKPHDMNLSSSVWGNYWWSDQTSGGAKSLVQTPFFTCFGKFGMGVYPIQYTIPSSQYLWSNNHWSLAGCDGKLGFIRGIRGFGIYARAHERRCAPAAQAGEFLGWTMENVLFGGFFSELQQSWTHWGEAERAERCARAWVWSLINSWFVLNSMYQSTGLHGTPAMMFKSCGPTSSKPWETNVSSKTLATSKLFDLYHKTPCINLII